jgi:16S rRNA (guanine966-N2)-methyltransferase
MDFLQQIFDITSDPNFFANEVEMLRITGGEWRGRSIITPPSLRTRPTQAKLRQALFNSLQIYIPGARVLDLFAGSGSLGFEAMSRGASDVVFVEASRAAVKIIEKNAEAFKTEDRVRILSESVDDVLVQLKKLGPFDVVLADPPYAEEWELKLLNTFPWGELLGEEGIFCLEWGVLKSATSELPDEVPHLIKVREKKYGDSVLTTYRRDQA